MKQLSSCFFGILMPGLPLHIILISCCDPARLNSDTLSLLWQIDKELWLNLPFLRKRFWCLPVLLGKSTDNMRHCYFLFLLQNLICIMNSLVPSPLLQMLAQGHLELIVNYPLNRGRHYCFSLQLLAIVPAFIRGTSYNPTFIVI
jgi:hypothetical protein